jgi:DNA-binding CsgD family transcriptional regulator
MAFGEVTSPVFVGRDSELAGLTAALRDVAGGTARSVLVAGEAGMGKSRLVAEAAARAERDGFRVLRGQCVEFGAQGMALVPLVEALRTLARTTRPDQLDTLLGPARSELSRLLPELDPGAWRAPRPDTVRSGQLLELVLGVLERVSALAPLLFVVEDIHWADLSTMELLAFLARTLRATPICLLMTFRPEELHRRHPLRPALRGWERDPAVSILKLGSFNRAEVAAQLEGILQAAPDPQLLARVTERAEGNPFLVEELTAAVRAGEPLSEVPESLRDVLLSRVDALSEPAQQLLRAASAAGRAVPDRLLAAVAGLDEGVLMGALREVVERQFLVVDDSGTGYVFRHSLLRHAVYEDTLPGEKLRLHALYAERLSDEPGLVGRDASPATELALHWYAALDLPRALTASIEAGRQAAVAYAPAEAQRHFERALEIWPRVEDAQERAGMDEVDVLRLASGAALQAGSLARALALLDRAAERIDHDGEPERLPELLERRAIILRSLGRDAEAITVVETALQMLEAEPATGIRAALLTVLARSLGHVRDLHAARRAAQAAVDAARSVGAREMEADALISLGTCQAYVGDLDRALDALRSGLELAIELGISETALRGYINSSDVLELAGRHAEAVEAAEQGIALAARVGLTRTYGAYLTGNLVDSLRRLGRWADADRAAQDAMLAAPEGAFAAGLRLGQAAIAVDSGRDADAGAHVREVRRLLGETSDDQFLQPLAWMEAEMARAQGDLDTARRVVAEGLESSVTLLWRYAWPLVWLGTRIEADAATRHRDLRGPVPDDVVTRAAELATLADELPAEMPPARAYRALVAAERVRLECAPGLDAWSAAAATCRDPGEPYLLSYALFRLAAEAFPAGERDAGIEALRESAALAEQIGAAPLIEEATALAQRARVVLDAGQPDVEPAPEPADPLASFGLTVREREILLLIAAGLSNGQIATELFISPKTASVHVSRILAKLGVSGRVEAAAVVHRLGLLRPEDMPAGR